MSGSDELLLIRWQPLEAREDRLYVAWVEVAEGKASRIRLRGPRRARARGVNLSRRERSLP